ncbi:MAG: helix-turn-helix transcriptional regulator [Lachnospiraceae bacterium]|nr:helix-turn-helix transcriptional regulator [Lachnospiraceae bacterium]
MLEIHGIEMNLMTREEQLPGFTADFPYIASCSYLDTYQAPIPWHWHNAVELFFLESGSIEYETPQGLVRFNSGSGGLVNTNVLHRTHVIPSWQPTIQKLHIFSTEFLSGHPGGRIESTYFLPMTSDPSFELLPLYPEDPEQRKILEQIREAFCLSEDAPGYEIRLHNALLDIWFLLYQQYESQGASHSGHSKHVEAVKTMMIYIREHFTESISIEEIAAAANLSQRVCYRVFADCLHVTPIEYVNQYRLLEACRLLLGTSLPITEIAFRCGFASGSYFNRVFLREKSCTPGDYRRKWQDSSKTRQ